MASGIGPNLERSRGAGGEGAGVMISVSAELVSVLVARPAPLSPPALPDHRPPQPTPPPIWVGGSESDAASGSHAPAESNGESAAAGMGRLGATSLARASTAGRVGPADENPAEEGRGPLVSPGGEAERPAQRK